MRGIRVSNVEMIRLSCSQTVTEIKPWIRYCYRRDSRSVIDLICPAFECHLIDTIFHNRILYRLYERNQQQPGTSHDYRKRTAPRLSTEIGRFTSRLFSAWFLPAARHSKQGVTATIDNTRQWRTQGMKRHPCARASIATETWGCYLSEHQFSIKWVTKQSKKPNYVSSRGWRWGKVFKSQENRVGRVKARGVQNYESAFPVWQSPPRTFSLTFMKFYIDDLPVSCLPIYWCLHTSQRIFCKR